MSTLQDKLRMASAYHLRWLPEAHFQAANLLLGMGSPRFHAAVRQRKGWEVWWVAWSGDQMQGQSRIPAYCFDGTFLVPVEPGSRARFAWPKGPGASSLASSLLAKLARASTRKVRCSADLQRAAEDIVAMLQPREWALPLEVLQAMLDEQVPYAYVEFTEQR